MAPASLRRRSIAGVVALVISAVVLGVGLFADVPKPLWYVGAGVLGALLAVAALSPTISKPFLQSSSWAYSKLFGAVGTLAGQNSLRNPRRTTATASALMIGLALATTMAIVGSSAKASVDDIIEENFVGDYVVSSTFGLAFSPSIATNMAAIDGVDQVVAQRFGLVEVDGDPEPISSVDPSALDGLLSLDFVKGSAGDLRDGTVIVSDDWAEGEDVTVGDRLTLDTPNGSKEYDVAGVFVANPMIASDVVTTPKSFLEAGFPDSDNFLIIDVTKQSDEIEAQLAGVVAANPLGHGEGPTGSCRRAASADRQPRVDDPCPAPARPVHRGPRHRQHPGALDDRTDQGGRVCFGRSAFVGSNSGASSPSSPS